MHTPLRLPSPSPGCDAGGRAHCRRHVKVMEPLEHTDSFCRSYGDQLLGKSDGCFGVEYERAARHGKARRLPEGLSLQQRSAFSVTLAIILWYRYPPWAPPRPTVALNPGHDVYADPGLSMRDLIGTLIGLLLDPAHLSPHAAPPCRGLHYLMP